MLQGFASIVTKQITKVALSFEWGHDQVREGLKAAINEQFADISKKLKTAKTAFAKDKELKHLGATCEALLKQATSIKTFLLEKPQFEALTEIMVSQGKEYGSFKDIADKFYASASFVQLKALASELLSAEIYNQLLPLLDTEGKFEKLALKEQLALVELLENDKSLEKVKALDLTDTFAKLKTQVKQLYSDFKLSGQEQAAINKMVSHVETKHLPVLQKIKKESEKDLPKLKQKLLALVYEKYPHLAAAQTQPKPVVSHKAKPKAKPQVEDKKTTKKKKKKI
ncbi:MAG: hypothetical protein JSR17_03540 [Proteobacteria bacterium]|nr:hypothetical protein [Pseudomonadota bacterium]